MSTAIDLAEGFEAHRGALMGLAYRMLGSRAEAEDVVQDAYLRWHAADRAHRAPASLSCHRGDAPVSRPDEVGAGAARAICGPVAARTRGGRGVRGRGDGRDTAARALCSNPGRAGGAGASRRGGTGFAYCNGSPPTIAGEFVDRPMERLSQSRSHRQWPSRLRSAGLVFVNGFIAVGVLAALAMLCHTPLVFPSEGPTAFLLCFKPTAPSASPRNTLCGHAIGIACGYAALCLLGLQDAPSAILEEIHWPRVLAAALSLAATGSLRILFRVVHPPAGATTLIISLGFITTPAHLCTIEVAVALMTLQAFAVNHLAGIDYPLWSRRVPPPPRDK